MARAHIPFFQQVPTKLNRQDIETIAKTFQDDVENSFYRVTNAIKNLGGRCEIVGYEAHDVYLESFGPKDFAIYTSSLLGLRHANWSNAINLAHHLLHFPIIAGAHGNAGMQVLTASGRNVVTGSEKTDEMLDLSSYEAIWFASKLFMPREEFTDHYSKHGPDGMHMFYNFPNRVVEMRAKRLGLSVDSIEKVGA